MISYSIGIILALTALYMTAGTGNAICLKSGKFNLGGEGQQLTVSTSRLNGGYGDGDTLNGNHFAGAGASSIGCGNPGLGGRRSADSLSGLSLKFTEEHAARRSRAGDKGTDGTDKGGNAGISMARSCNSSLSDFVRHASVAHDFSCSDNGDNGERDR